MIVIIIIIIIIIGFSPVKKIKIIKTIIIIAL